MFQQGSKTLPNHMETHHSLLKNLDTKQFHELKKITPDEAYSAETIS
jgi:hypothetical protein